VIFNVSGDKGVDLWPKPLAGSGRLHCAIKS
jgi:hypothetical protein